MDARAATAVSPTRPSLGVRSDVMAALKDAALAALVTLGLSIPILSYRTDQGLGVELILRPRWGLVALFCALAFAARLRLHGIGAGRRIAAARPQALATHPEDLSLIQRAGKLGLPLFLAVALTLPILVYFAKGGLSESRYWIDLGILILTYVMLGWGLNIVVGLAGLLDLGYVAFYAVGAYCYALLGTQYGLSFWILLPAAGAMAAFWGVILGFPVLRLRGDYLAIVTLAFGEIIRVVLINWVEFTNGPRGILGIPRPTLFGIEFDRGEGSFADLLG